MSNEEKYNKVQQLFIEITGCNPEKNVFEVKQEFIDIASRVDDISLAEICRIMGLDWGNSIPPEQYALASTIQLLVEKMQVYIDECRRVTKHFRALKPDDEWLEDDVQD